MSDTLDRTIKNMTDIEKMRALLLDTRQAMRDMDNLREVRRVVLENMTAQRDALKTVAKEVLFVLEKHGVDHELQERLQLAICNLPADEAKERKG